MEIKKLELDELNLPEEPARAPQINWGQDFEDWDKGHQVRYLKKLCSALNHATDLIQKERDALLDKMAIANAVAENAGDATNIQKSIVLNAITAHNEEKQNLISRIQELESDIKNKDKYIQALERL